MASCTTDGGTPSDPDICFTLRSVDDEGLRLQGLADSNTQGARSLSQAAAQGEPAAGLPRQRQWPVPVPCLAMPCEAGQSTIASVPPVARVDFFSTDIHDIRTTCRAELGSVLTRIRPRDLAGSCNVQWEGASAPACDLEIPRCECDEGFGIEAPQDLYLAYKFDDPVDHSNRDPEGKSARIGESALVSSLPSSKASSSEWDSVDSMSSSLASDLINQSRGLGSTRRSRASAIMSQSTFSGVATEGQGGKQDMSTSPSPFAPRSQGYEAAYEAVNRTTVTSSASGTAFGWIRTRGWRLTSLATADARLAGDVSSESWGEGTGTSVRPKTGGVGESLGLIECSEVLEGVVAVAVVGAGRGGGGGGGGAGAGAGLRDWEGRTRNRIREREVGLTESRLLQGRGGFERGRGRGREEEVMVDF
ncbi:hypothetical protein AXG93_2584s1370 [Marchantia polymorpha subsp. ruderalis]|uniref:Uncharacterized protein n=1 Tax=Marchantia polymorpha subsp. ruderalis TaxID=1480154 RepID=A0A176VI26_MARPO|nr:hypothetical protein AXG93_2584s1370 [Marchantia polymorpha subsp. ruderalis]